MMAKRFSDSASTFGLCPEGGLSLTSKGGKGALHSSATKSKLGWSAGCQVGRRTVLQGLVLRLAREDQQRCHRELPQQHHQEKGAIRGWMIDAI